jgi:hypothetical protein
MNRGGQLLVDGFLQMCTENISVCCSMRGNEKGDKGGKYYPFLGTLEKSRTMMKSAV